MGIECVDMYTKRIFASLIRVKILAQGIGEKKKRRKKNWVTPLDTRLCPRSHPSAVDASPSLDEEEVEAEADAEAEAESCLFDKV